MSRGEVTVGGIVLCGGKSSRMGMAKATLPFGPELMLQRVVRLLQKVVRPIVVVAAATQELPELPSDILTTRDEREGRGPLQGLHAGLLALQDRVEAVFATSCDVPLLQPAFVSRMIDELGDNDAAVPVQDGFHHPLAAVYRVSALPLIEEMLAADQLRPRMLYDRVATRLVSVNELRIVDAELATLKNLNHPSDYIEALRLAGFELLEEVSEHFSQLDLSENHKDHGSGA
ncbi:MAG: molybdopterin-guanine dinucleotide biosynthesis protein MobA [Planctomycetaceae bacterium]|nr:molybdopterin-guanine dinucleotide biosynthesis protein MobA [Planctomycetaceae bacterium]